MRVFITGMGLVNGAGSGVHRLMEALDRGISKVAVLSDPRLSDRPYGIGAEALDFDPLSVKPAHEARHLDRFILLALKAAQEALGQAGLRAGEEALHPFGVFAGTALGGVRAFWDDGLAFQASGRVSPFFLPKFIPNMAATTLAIDLGCVGPNLTYVTACAASANALGEAFHAVRDARIPGALVLGTETLFVPPVMAGLASARALSTRRDDPGTAARPFSRGRDGMVMGEGGAAIVLESEDLVAKRGSTPLAEVIGYGAGSDAHHPTAPHPQGDGAYRAMADALDDAGILPDDVDYINAHGTSTPAGDLAESRAMTRLFGRGMPPVGSIKGTVGHLMGAAGATEAIVCVEAMRRGVLPPSVNYLEKDPEIDLPIVTKPLPGTYRVALTNSFGFGGQNASVVLRRID